MRVTIGSGLACLGLLVAAAVGERAATRPASRPAQPPPAKEQVEAAKKAGLQPVIEVDLGKGQTMRLVLIPAGTFRMGSPPDERGHQDYERQHQVTLTKPFYLGVTEVTQAQWEAVTGDRPWKKGEHVKADPGDAANYVPWDDCPGFFKKLNARVPGGGFRLPTEAEWERACRAGTTTRYSFGEDKDGAQIGDFAWYKVNTLDAGVRHPRAVALKKPNPWGLYDMHGNVFEWCADYWGDYPAGAVTDPVCNRKSLYRVIRGGSWAAVPEHCRSAARGGLQTWFHNNFIFHQMGLRCARTAKPLPTTRPTAPPKDFGSFPELPKS